MAFVFSIAIMFILENFDKLGFARSQRAMHSLAEWAAGSLLTGRRIRAKMYRLNAATVSKLCLRTCRHGSVTCELLR